MKSVSSFLRSAAGTVQSFNDLVFKETFMKSIIELLPAGIFVPPPPKQLSFTPYTGLTRKGDPTDARLMGR